MELPVPPDIEDWTWEQVEELSAHTEGQYLEFKERLHAGDNVSSDEWQRDLERELTAFANASGGVVVFGVTDDGDPAPFEPPEHELDQSITRLIQNTTPLVDVTTSGPLEPPSDETDRVALAVVVDEATRKPVLTGDSAVYVRINDRKEPMSREQMESMFVEQDRRQQAIRQLEMEITRLFDILSENEREFDRNRREWPNFHLLNLESLKAALRENTHLHADADTQGALRAVFSRLQDIDHYEVLFERMIEDVDRGMESFPHSRERYYQNVRNQLDKRLSLLKRALETLIRVADLDVETPDD